MSFWNTLTVLLVIVMKSSSVRTNSGLYQLNLAQDRIINSNTICGNTPGLTALQAQQCLQHPHSVASAIQGMQIAIHECKEQFKGNRWNCSALETKNKIPYSGSFLTNANGNQEAAFSFAISSAGVVHQVAHACSLGKIKECECQQIQPEHLTASQRKKFQKQLHAMRPEVNRPVHAFERAGCNHNINYGLQFAVNFLDSDQEQDIVAEIRSHNNRVGRLVVANNMQENCRCHGTSGSCSQKTCWRKTPDFRKVGLAIKEKYNTAVKMAPRISQNEGRESNRIGGRTSFETSAYNVQDLIYIDESPDYCLPELDINVRGTRGRFCNSTAAEGAPNSCENLCCNRGYKVLTIKRVEQCGCKFHWCCYVNCEECEWEETVSVCN